MEPSSDSSMLAILEGKDMSYGKIYKLIRGLNWRNGNLTKKVSYLKKNLKDIQTEVEKDPFNCDLKERSVKSRKHKGRIESICDENRTRFDGDNMADAFVELFKKFLGTKHAVQPLNSVEINFKRVLSEDEAEDMISMVTDDIK
ncbi:hypothetical protein Tco_1506453 [Tanacetum coccineum]